MPGDFVNEVYPSSKIQPVSPHPANVREERKKRQKRRQRQKGGRHWKDADRDKVSLEKDSHRKPEKKGKRQAPEKSSEKPEKKRTIDITI